MCRLRSVDSAEAPCVVLINPLGDYNQFNIQENCLLDGSVPTWHVHELLQTYIRIPIRCASVTVAFGALSRLAQTSGALAFFLGQLDKLQFGDLFLITSLTGRYCLFNFCVCVCVLCNSTFFPGSLFLAASLTVACGVVFVLCVCRWCVYMFVYTHA